MLLPDSIKLSTLSEQLKEQVVDELYGRMNHMPIRYAQGACPWRGIVFCLRGKTPYIRRYTKPTDPQTPDQLIDRGRWGDTKRNWADKLSQEQRDEWKRYGMRYGLAPNSKGNIGYNSYMKVMTYRVAVAPELGWTAPENAPATGEIFHIEQLPAAGGDCLAFRVEHSIKNFTGMWLLVEMTPPTEKLTRKPREGDLRWVCGMGCESFVPLKASGESYALEDAQFAVAPGQRYGIRLQVISADGVPGSEMERHFVRCEYASPDAGLSQEQAGEDRFAPQESSETNRCFSRAALLDADEIRSLHTNEPESARRKEKIPKPTT